MSANTSKKSSIKRTLVGYLFFVGLVPLLIGWSLVYVYGQRSARDTIGTGFQEIAVETAHRVDSVVETEIHRVRLLASVPILIKRQVMQANERYAGLSEAAVRELLARQEEAWAKGNFPYEKVLASETARFLTQSKDMAGNLIMGILITDIQGAVVAATSQPKRFTHAHEHWWREAHGQAAGFLYVSDIVEQGRGTFLSQGDTFDVAIAILGPDEKPVGVLKVCYRFDSLFALVNQIRIGETGHAMLFASDGAPLMCPILPRKAHRMDRQLLNTIVSGKAGWATVEDDGHGARQTVVGFAPLEGFKRLRANGLNEKTWHVFVRQHPDESLAPMRSLLFKVGGVGIVLLGVLALLGNYVGARLVRPIQALREGVEKIRTGDLSSRISVRTSNELEDLGDTINAMATQLQASRAELESCNRSLVERVADRTKELARQVRRTDAILTNMAEGLIILNGAREVQFMNPAARRLYDASIGQPCAQLFYGRQYPCTQHDHSCPTTECPIEGLLSGHREVYEYETKDQQGRILLVTMVPTAGEAGEALIVVLLRDITREAKLKRQLYFTEKLASMGKMAGGIAHEINNPLGIIINRIECIERETRGQDLPVDLLNDLVAIKNHAKRISRITKSLLVCSRDSLITLKPIDVNTVIREALGLVADQMAKAEIRLTTELSDDLPLVMGDKDKLETVVLNLLNNAIDAALPAGGAISVHTREVSFEQNGGVEISVRDNGVGIPPEAYERLFEPFFTTKPAANGTGLGLFLSYGIVKEHRGEINAAPNSDGAGSLFTVKIPGLGREAGRLQG